ncbi:hypothetical protein B0181_08995 [Moraxella caviae]|uniref:Uncharacterized protein n=1 Tax=Moraxella caviae TaxID=34060 RepID=A0A1S9ZXA4_9GAMM|nr:hypothetical protein [Moraxella caviae]OOR88078.1 hypothetical protein B0181_08995 [Moraxella caviae]STZ09979.1 Uncharacterised protein [Moraxella caviae]
MTWTTVLQSHDFEQGGGVVVSSSFITMEDVKTKKFHSYSIKNDLEAVEIKEANEVATLLNGIKNLGVVATAGVVGTAGLGVALGAVAVGAALPKHTKLELIVSLLFKDGKSAILRMSQKTYDKIMKKHR